MSKHIDVKGHAKRYEDTDPVEVIELIKELTEMLERRRIEEIERVKKHLAVLESGEMPASNPVEQRKARSPKKVKE
jgi:hypothetical protein